MNWKKLKTMKRMDSLDQINKDILSCQRCALRAGATAPVPGYGNEKPKYIIITAAPGREEDEAGIPLVGYAGKKLNTLLALANININDCYLTMVCRCRLPKVNGKTRNPKKKEINLCEKYLWRELRILGGPTIITLGATPLSLFHTDGVAKLHGTGFTFKIPEEKE